MRLLGRIHVTKSLVGKGCHGGSIGVKGCRMQILLDALRVIHAWYFCLTCLGIELELQNDRPPRSALRMRHCVQTFQRLLPRIPFKNIRRILPCSCIAVDCAIVLGRQTGCKRLVHSSAIRTARQVYICKVDKLTQGLAVAESLEQVPVADACSELCFIWAIATRNAR